MKNPRYENIRGVIYDVDDTLLDNHPALFEPFGIHAHSRLAAIHQAGRELGITALVQVTHEQNAQSFLDSKEHSVEGALWRLLTDLNMVEGLIDRNHELVRKIVELKAVIHEELLLANGLEVRGASDFVRFLGDHDIPQAIASGARRSEIVIFLKKYALENHFPDHRIIAKYDYVEPKPNPESFVLALSRLQLPDSPKLRKQIFAFEDDPKGVQAAKLAGLYVCALTTRFPRKSFMNGPHQPDIIAADFVEYAELLGVAGAKSRDD